MDIPARLNLLLVDDEEDFALTLAQRLGLRGVSAAVAFDGESALTSLQQKQFDLVVLDVHLPGASGLSILRRIREEHPDLPVVLLTGNTGAEDAALGMKQGAQACLTKPLELQEFLALLARLCTKEKRA